MRQYGEGSDDFDREDDEARLEHYIVNGTSPRLLPDMSEMERFFYEGVAIRRSSVLQ